LIEIEIYNLIFDKIKPSQMLATLAKTVGLGSLLKKDKVVCDSFDPLPFALEAERYMGNWYEIYHSSGEPFQPDSWICNQATYTDLDSEGNFKVYNSGQTRFGGPRFGVHGKAKCPATSGSGQCFVTFFFQPFDSQPNYRIIDTDYENYSLIYSCDENDMQYLWLMSREPTLSDELYNQMIATAQEKVPHYDFSQLIMDKQNANKCKWVSDV